jgi:hypothetical protein
MDGKMKSANAFSYPHNKKKISIVYAENDIGVSAYDYVCKWMEYKQKVRDSNKVD